MYIHAPSPLLLDRRSVSGRDPGRKGGAGGKGKFTLPLSHIQCDPSVNFSAHVLLFLFLLLGQVSYTQTFSLSLEKKGASDGSRHDIMSRHVCD